MIVVRGRPNCLLSRWTSSSRSAARRMAYGFGAGSGATVRVARPDNLLVPDVRPVAGELVESSVYGLSARWKSVWRE